MSAVITDCTGALADLTTLVMTWIIIKARLHFLQDCMRSQRRLVLACTPAQATWSLRGPHKDGLGPWLPT